MKKILYLVLILSFTSSAQSLAGRKFALDPGHGSPRSATCEPETKRFETYVNHIVVPYLKQYLISAGATVITTRADFDSLGPCITLSDREAIANNNNVEYFQSVHHNAFQGTANYSLVLFEQIRTLSCPTGNPQWPGQTDVMAAIQAQKLFANMYTTNGYPRGDSCFLGYNLGVLNNLNMPGTLSEGSFFDFPQERIRLANLDYLRTEAQTLFYSFLQYYNQPLPSYATITGVITNSALGTPVKKVRVEIPSAGKTYMIDSLGNGYYRFDSLAAGSYTIYAYTSTDTSSFNINVAAGSINKANFSIEQAEDVGPVKLLSVTPGPGTINLSWEKPSGLTDTIDIYLSEDGTNFPSVPFRKVAGSVTSLSFSGLTPNQSYYVKLKGRNIFGESPYFSKTYGAYTASSGDRVLIVDAFNRYGGSGSYQFPYHNFASYYGEALTQLGIRFATVTNSAITNSTQLNGNKYIIWFCGDESTADETFTTQEQNFVKTYLQNGGYFLTTGSEIAWDLDSRGSATDKDFINNWLKASFSADNPTPNTPVATGVQNTIFQRAEPFNFGQTYPEDWADVISPAGGSSAILRYNATQTAGIAWKGLYPTASNEGAVVFISFPLETISDAASRKFLIEKSFQFFNNGVLDATDEDEDLKPETYNISVYPNPFNPVTRIDVKLPETAEYRLEVYDVLGSKVLDIFSGELSAGKYTFTLDMSLYNSGIYFLRVVSEKINHTQKLVLVK